MRTLGQFTIFVVLFLRATLTHPPPVRATLRQAYHIGVHSLPILLIICTFVGTNLSLQGYNAFKPLGGENLVGMFVALAGTRELGPIVVAAMVAAKAGTEMASQLAVMRIHGQIDALEVMAINPRWYLITPRFIGILLVLPPLTIISIFTVILSSWAVAVWQLGINSRVFIISLSENTRMLDFGYCALKAVLFGALICLVSCFCGFNSRPGPKGVGQATNMAVVASAVLCAVVNYLVSELLYG